MIFNGRNIIPNAPEELTKVVYFLNEKADVGEFEFSEKPSYWAKHEGIIKPLGLGHDGAGYYFAVSLAFIAVKKDGDSAYQRENQERRQHSLVLHKKRCQKGISFFYAIFV